MDMNDRSLRHIVVGLGGSNNGITREEGFNIADIRSDGDSLSF